MQVGAVTVRGPFGLMSLAVVLAMAAVAQATTPLPPFEKNVAPGNKDIAFVKSEIFEKNPTIEETCVRTYICAGPYDPDINFKFGKTGARVLTNDTNVTVGHDPTRHFSYGPYTFPFIVDDIRICATGCTFPNAFYAHAEAHVRVELYFMGTEPKVYNVHLYRRDVDLEQPSALAQSCELQRYYECTPLI